MATEVTRQRIPPTDEIPIVAPGQSLKTVTEKIADIVLRLKTPLSWFFGFTVGFLLLQGLLVAIMMLLSISMLHYSSDSTAHG